MPAENIPGQREPSTKLEPDPSPRTMDQLYREVELLGQRLETKIDGNDEKYGEIFIGLDKALKLLQAFADKSPTTSNVDGKVDALRDLANVQIAALKELFDKLNTQRDKYEERIANILAEQKSKDALLLSTQVDKLGISTGERLGAVEKNQYTTGGMAGVRDPQLTGELARISAIVETLAKSGNKTEGREIGRGEIIAWAVAAITAAAAFVALFAKFST